MVRTQRFVEVAAPLDERVGGTVATRIREAVSISVDVQGRINQTVHDEALRKRAAHTAIDAVRPGTITFWLIVIAVLAYCVQRWIVHRETMRIVREHGAPCHERPAATPPPAAPDADRTKAQ